jgi:ABC-type transport system involved in cytochrome c biogenesis permease subunit
MINSLWILISIALYGLSLIGGKNGKMLFVLGFLLHTGYVIYRGLSLGWVPVMERHDILLVMGLIVAGSFFYLNKKMPLNMILDVLPLFVILLSLFAVFQIRMDSIEPYMDSSWFYMHIIFLILGYSLFTISSIAGISYLRNRIALYEMIQYRLALFGWLFFSFSLIGGSFWFYYIYGSYWLWTAKELWITIVWFYYSFYLHGRLVKALSGKPSVILGVAGFPIIMFSYLGVMPVIGSPWTQF